MRILLRRCKVIPSAEGGDLMANARNTIAKPKTATLGAKSWRHKSVSAGPRGESLVPLPLHGIDGEKEKRNGEHVRVKIVEDRVRQGRRDEIGETQSGCGEWGGGMMSSEAV